MRELNTQIGFMNAIQKSYMVFKIRDVSRVEILAQDVTKEVRLVQYKN